MTNYLDQLPPNWEKHVDPVSGRSYFIDHKNKKTQWLDPRLTSNDSIPQLFPGMLSSLM
jgi:hypothetical protein